MKTLKKYNLKQGLNLYYIPLEKFKTCTVTIFIHRKLCKEDATKNALLPYVLRRGSKNFPDSKAIATYLESLYGSAFDCGINKKGEDQMIYFSFDVVDEHYISDNESLFKNILSFAKQIIFDPVVENDAFKKEYVKQEKEQLKDLINSLVNNKAAYAVERCFQEMCKDEAFGIYELGNIEDLDGIDEKNLYEHYMDIIHSSPIDIFITGNLEENKILDWTKNIFDIKLNENILYPTTDIISKVNNKKNIEEKMDVAQGKLSLGFRTGISPRDKEYYSLILYNGVLGGGPHSKLFNNVREKMSLAYYVFSRLDKFKGLMVISSGIEIQNFQKALDEIEKQMKEIKDGNISDYEYDSTMNSAINSIRSLADNALHITDYYVSQLIGGTEDSFDVLIDKISRVTKQDIISVAQNIELDTVYFLKNKS